MKKIKKIALFTMALLITTTCIYSFAKLKEESVQINNKQKEGAFGTEKEAPVKINNLENNLKASNRVLDDVVYSVSSNWEGSFGIPLGYKYYRVYYKNNASTTAIVTIKHSGKTQHRFTVSAGSDRTYHVKDAVKTDHRIVITGKGGATVEGIIRVRISKNPL